jgi:hypothetical protein
LDKNEAGFLEGPIAYLEGPIFFSWRQSAQVRAQIQSPSVWLCFHYHKALLFLLLVAKSACSDRKTSWSDVPELCQSLSRGKVWFGVSACAVESAIHCKLVWFIFVA